MAMVNRFGIYLVSIDATPKGAKNTRPCVIVSPDEMNRNVSHVLIAPISSARNGYPTRIRIELLNSTREIVLDQIRAVDKDRLVKKIGDLDPPEQKAVLDRLQELFAP
jgi:mRNA interferase MazF